MSNSYTFFIVIALKYFWNFADIQKYVQAIKIINNILLVMFQCELLFL